MPNFSTNWAIDVYEPNILKHMSHFAHQPIDYLEVGVFEGQSAWLMYEHILTHPNSTYTGVDNREGDKYFRKVIKPQSNLCGLHNVTLLDGNSTKVLQDLNGQGKEYDICYIDGNHNYAHVLIDTTLVWSLATGMIFWDDYWPSCFGVKNAVHDFLRNIPNSSYKVIEKGYQFGIMKL